MSNTTTVYIPTPVNEPPNATGYYGVIKTGIDGKEMFDQDGYFIDVKQWLSEMAPNGIKTTHWLRKVEVTNDSPVQSAIDNIKKDIGCSEDECIACKSLKWAVSVLEKRLPADLARSAHISNLESIRDKQLLDIAAMAKEISDLKGEREKIAGDAFDLCDTYKGFVTGAELEKKRKDFLQSLNTQS